MIRATADERARALPGDDRIPEAIDMLTHGVTIRRAPREVWPWLVQMGAGSRGGWYSYDWLDNGRQPSATRVLPERQHPPVGTIGNDRKLPKTVWARLFTFAIGPLARARCARCRVAGSEWH